MNTKAREALNKLADDDKLAFKLARALFKAVHTYKCDQRIFCTPDGGFYIAYANDRNGTDEIVYTATAADFSLPIGPEYAGSKDGWATFDDIEDSVWEDAAIDIKAAAAELGG